MNREMHLYYVPRRKKPNYKKGLPHKLFPNLLNQNFVVKEPNRVWCTDFTYLYLTNGQVRYNWTIIDLYDRSVVASENGKFITGDLAIRTLDKAIHALTAILRILFFIPIKECSLLPLISHSFVKPGESRKVWVVPELRTTTHQWSVITTRWKRNWSISTIFILIRNLTMPSISLLTAGTTASAHTHTTDI